MKTDPFDLRLRAAASTLLSHMESDLESIGSRAKTTIAIQLFRPGQQSFYHYGRNYERLKEEKIQWPADSAELRARVGSFIKKLTGVEPDWRVAAGRPAKLDLSFAKGLDETLLDNLKDSRKHVAKLQGILECAEKSTDQVADFRRQLLVGIPQSVFRGSLRCAHELIAGDLQRARAKPEDFVRAHTANVAEHGTLALLAPLEEKAGMAAEAGHSLILPVRTVRTRQFLGVIHYFRHEPITDAEADELEEIHEGLQSVVIDAYEQDFHSAYGNHLEDTQGDCFTALARAAAQYFNVWLSMVLRKGELGPREDALIPEFLCGWPSLARPGAYEQDPILEDRLLYGNRTWDLGAGQDRETTFRPLGGAKTPSVEHNGDHEFEVRFVEDGEESVKTLHLPKATTRTILGSAGMESLDTENVELQGGRVGDKADPYRPRSIFRVDRKDRTLALVLTTPTPADEGERTQLIKEIARALFRAMHSQTPYSESTRQSTYQPAKTVPWERIPLSRNNRSKLERHISKFQHAPRLGIRGHALTLLLHGRPGTGKTYLAETLLRIMAGTEMELDVFIREHLKPVDEKPDPGRAQRYLPEANAGSEQGPIWVRVSLGSAGSSYFSETDNRLQLAIRGLASYARKNNCVVGILLDEVDQLSRSREELTGIGFDPSATMQSELSRVENERLIVIATGNYAEKVEKALLDRFLAVELTLPTQKQRVAMIEQLNFTIAPGWHIEAEVAKDVARHLEKRAYRDISRVLRSAIGHRVHSSEGEPDFERALSLEDFLPGIEELAAIGEGAETALEKAHKLDLDLNGVAQWAVELLELVDETAPTSQSDLFVHGPVYGKDPLRFGRKHIGGLKQRLDEAYARNGSNGAQGKRADVEEIEESRDLLDPKPPVGREQEPDAAKE